MNSKFLISNAEAVKEVSDVEKQLSLKKIVSMIPEDTADDILAHFNPNIMRKVFGDAELMRTAECFLRSSLNISAAARNIFMHRNTMMYRLDKIERLTGLDVRTFDDALTFEVLHILYDRKLRSEK
ncbi:MAG: helix-turn-helix domain-containing protein [Clostridia bacterium]|nr:helix-turn-helix domain-containing protein [Clostridia bacterium]